MKRVTVLNYNRLIIPYTFSHEATKPWSLAIVDKIVHTIKINVGHAFEV